MKLKNNCESCTLAGNQIIKLKKDYSVNVLWVGLSAKKVKQGCQFTPLSADTNTGRIIQTIELGLPGYTFFKTNLVKCAPLDENQKLRYPSKNEKQSCFGHLEDEINTLSPNIVFLLGMDVAKFVLGQKKISLNCLNSDYNYDFYRWNETFFVPIHHPSFIHIYKRKQIDEYINKISNLITKLLINKNIEKVKEIAS